MTRRLTLVILLVGGALLGPALVGDALSGDRGAAEALASAPEAAASEAFTRGAERFRAAQALAQEAPGEQVALRSAYREAGDAFAAAFAAGHASVEVCVNAANAYALAGAHAPAALFYRRGLLLDPRNRRAADGLAAVRDRLAVRPAELTATESLASALFFWHRALGFGARQWLFLALYLGGALAIATGLARGRPRTAWTGLAAAGLGLCVFGSLWLSAEASQPRRDAVLVTRAVGRTGDGAMYSPSHSAPLPPGTELRAVEEREGWVEAELLDGSTGWFPAETLAWVVPR